MTAMVKFKHDVMTKMHLMRPPSLRHPQKEKKNAQILFLELNYVFDE